MQFLPTHEISSHILKFLVLVHCLDSLTQKWWCDMFSITRLTLANVENHRNRLIIYMSLIKLQKLIIFKVQTKIYRGFSYTWF